MNREDSAGLIKTEQQELDDLKKRFAATWGSTKSTSSEKRALIKQYQDQLLPDVLAGADLANGKAKYRQLCLACHQLHGEGGTVGPELTGAEASALGITMTLTAVFGYALTGNVVVPLQQRYGGMAVVAYAQGLAAALLLPLGLAGISDSRFEIGPVIAVVFLGVVGTGVARSLSATIAGRAGPQRVHSPLQPPGVVEAEVAPAAEEDEAEELQEVHSELQVGPLG